MTHPLAPHSSSHAFGALPARARPLDESRPPMAPQAQPDASRSYLVLPMLLRGLLVMFIAIPVANLSFRVFELDDFAHSYRLKNIVRQLVISFATSSVIVLEQHRQALHYTRLADHVSVYAPQAAGWLADSTQHLLARGYAPPVAHDMAVAEMARLVVQQANTLALLDGFTFLVGVALVGGAFSLWQKQIR